MKEKINEINESIYEFHSEKTFLKIKNSALSIGKVLFAFVTTENNKAVKEKSFDCYLSIAEALSLATDISFGKIARLAETEKKLEKKYPSNVWDSGLGGVNEQKAKEKGMRTDGMAISRAFGITCGMKKPFVFVAKQGSGKTAENGLITPVKTEVTVFVPVQSEQELKNMAEEMKLAIYSYMAGKYARYYPYEQSKLPQNENSNTQSQNTVNNVEKPEIKANSSVEPTNSVEKLQPQPELLVQAQMKSYSKLQATTSNNGTMCMQVIDEKNVIHVLIFSPADIKRVEPAKWQAFEKLVNVDMGKFTFNYIKAEKNSKEYLYFKGFLVS